MNGKLVAWARAVKMRKRTHWPVLWLFTDSSRPDPRTLVRMLPRGLSGVVLRHDHDPDRARLGHDLAQICRARRNLLVVAGDARLARALRAGLHLRRGRRGIRGVGRGQPLTSSVHNEIELRQARCAGARIVFLSPLFATPSHPGQRGLGTLRWATLARQAGIPCMALGGLAPATITAIPRSACGLGAIRSFEGEINPALQQMVNLG
jgi:thiamine-phosphate pyrophosphorylase